MIKANWNQSSYAKASEDTPGSNDFVRLTGVSHPKLEERRVVPGAGIEPATQGFSIPCSTN